MSLEPLILEKSGPPNKEIGHIILNSPERLNALGLEVINSIYSKLSEWRSDDRVVCVTIESKSDRAFCAGGDLKEIYQKMSLPDQSESVRAYHEYFSAEYRLNYLLHTFPKPIIAWADGYVLGGGLGVFAGATFRLASERTSLAMPEVAIGFFPDVGASWFLNRLPEWLGLFVGLSGVRLNAKDGWLCGLVDRVITGEDWICLREGLTGFSWSNDLDHSLSLLAHELDKILKKRRLARTEEVLESRLWCSSPQIRSLFSGYDSGTIVERCSAFLESPRAAGEPWLKEALTSVLLGSPLAREVTARQLNRCRFLSLEQCLDYELGLSIACCRRGDFKEGIRSRIIEKDNNPKWRFRREGDIQASDLEYLFSYRHEAPPH